MNRLTEPCSFDDTDNHSPSNAKITINCNKIANLKPTINRRDASLALQRISVVEHPLLSVEQMRSIWRLIAIKAVKDATTTIEYIFPTPRERAFNDNAQGTLPRIRVPHAGRKC